MHKTIIKLIYNGILKTDSIIEAFANISRSEFVSANLRSVADSDISIPTGYGYITANISTTARILESLSPKKGDRVLVLGDVDGWITTLMIYIVGETGFVLTVSRIKNLKESLESKTKEFDFMNSECNFSIKIIDISNVENCCKNLNEKLFDRIIILETLMNKCDIDKLLVSGGVCVKFTDDSTTKFYKLKK